MKFTLIFLFASLLFLNSCDKGIEPLPVGIGFSGTINFIGKWPEGVTRTYLVVFKNELKSASDFSPLNIKFISNEIPYGTSKLNYSSADSAFGSISPGKYEYVVVAQSKTPTLSLNRSDWFVAGVYYNNSDTTKPGVLVVPENGEAKNINITCDFNNPPVQPPGGTQQIKNY